MYKKYWSEEEELTLLNAVIDFTSQTGQDPLTFYNAHKFHNFVKNSLDVEVSRSQLIDKLRRMKKRKFRDGDGPASSKPQISQKVIELSKKAWGSDPGGGEEATRWVEKPKKSVLKSSKKKEIGGESVGLILREFYRSQTGFELDDSEVKRGLGLIPESIRAELKAKWIALRNAEMELLVRRLQLAAEITELVVQSLLSPHN